jgi:hypothetical protein
VCKLDQREVWSQGGGRLPVGRLASAAGATRRLGVPAAAAIVPLTRNYGAPARPT